MQNNVAPDGAYMDIEQSTGVLYKVEPDLRIVPMEGGVGISNATCWSPDHRTMYFADTLLGAIHAYDFDLELGAISNKRVFAKPDSLGFPDGATVDAEGYVWNARWEGGSLIRFAPDGAVDAVVAIPASRVTCCAFGGDDLDTLYVTTSRLHLTEQELAEQPQAGGIFALKPGVKGLPRLVSRDDPFIDALARESVRHELFARAGEDTWLDYAHKSNPTAKTATSSFPTSSARMCWRRRARSSPN